MSSLGFVVVISGPDVVCANVGAADVSINTVGTPVGAVGSDVVGVSECADEGTEVGNVVGGIVGAIVVVSRIVVAIVVIG